MHRITIEMPINESVEKVWECYTNPKHIVKWNQASSDWHSPRAENDLRVGGRFLTRMEAKDGSEGFDFAGEYTEVEPLKRIAYTMTDGRTVDVHFEEIGNSTGLTISFDPESENPPEVQKEGWQAILTNFKEYVEKV